MFWSIKSEWLE
jgi:hypothetical protein